MNDNNAYGNGHGDGLGNESGHGWGTGAGDGLAHGYGNGWGNKYGEGYGVYGLWLKVLGAPEELEDHPIEAHHWILYPDKREQIMGIIALKKVTL